MPLSHVRGRADVWQVCEQPEGTMRGSDVRCVGETLSRPPPHAYATRPLGGSPDSLSLPWVTHGERQVAGACSRFAKQASEVASPHVLGERGSSGENARRPGS